MSCRSPFLGVSLGGRGGIFSLGLVIYGDVDVDVYAKKGC